MMTSSGRSFNADRGTGEICQNLAGVICERFLMGHIVGQAKTVLSLSLYTPVTIRGFIKLGAQV